jgi:hypothetical protein
MAVGFAALAGALRERPAQKPLAGGDLRNAGTESTLGGGEFGAAEAGSHVLYISYTRPDDKTRVKTQCEYAQDPPSGQNDHEIRYSGRPENTGRGIAGRSTFFLAFAADC